MRGRNLRTVVIAGHKFHEVVAQWDFACPECRQRKFRGKHCWEVRGVGRGLGGTSPKAGVLIVRLCSQECATSWTEGHPVAGALTAGQRRG